MVCPYDTNGDGNCGRDYCIYCGRFPMKSNMVLVTRHLNAVVPDTTPEDLVYMCRGIASKYEGLHDRSGELYDYQVQGVFTALADLFQLVASTVKTP